MTPAEYDRFSESLCLRLKEDTHVLALVALGSAAAPERRDAYSDHDFWVVVSPGTRAGILEDTSWLPDTENMVSAIRTGVRYLVVVYNSGHTMEVGVFEPDELSEGKLGIYRLVFDRHGIEERLAEVATRSAGRPPTPDDRSECELMFTILLTGAARAARGEHLSAHKYIRFFALDFLLGLLVRNKPLGASELIDPLDPWRRFDDLDPAVAAELHTIFQLPVMEAALRLLDLTERELRSVLPDYPRRAAEVARSTLHRLSASADSGSGMRE